MVDTMTFVATGDSFITRHLPTIKSEQFQRIKKIIQEGEFRFTNLEVTTHNFEGFPSAVSGGTWAIANPNVLQDIKNYDFNIMAWANNHTLDYSYGGLYATEKYINEYGFVHAGVGKNLADASSPKYLDCPSGRIALIAATSTFHESSIAGEQRPDMMGRPGINPLRYNTKFVVSEEKIEQLKSISEGININADHNLAIKEGFANPSNKNTLRFGMYEFEVGKKEGKKTKPIKRDLDRIIHSIEEARQRADYVIVSIHSHEMEGGDKSVPPDFLKTFARSCIDFGAHAIIGHGPHILRGIEIYNKRPIFYSLGNFIFQNDTVSKLPHDFYEKYGMGLENNVSEALDKRSDNGKRGLGVNPDVWESIIPLWTMKNGLLEEIKLYPIALGFDMYGYQKGWPKLTNNIHVIERLRELSKPFDTEIKIKDNIGFIRI